MSRGKSSWPSDGAAMTIKRATGARRESQSRLVTAVIAAVEAVAVGDYCNLFGILSMHWVVPRGLAPARHVGHKAITSSSCVSGEKRREASDFGADGSITGNMGASAPMSAR